MGYCLEQAILEVSSGQITETSASACPKEEDRCILKMKGKQQGEPRTVRQVKSQAVPRPEAEKPATRRSSKTIPQPAFQAPGGQRSRRAGLL